MLVLTCKNIEKSYGSEKILKNINFNLRSGDKVGLVGLNGSGKTSLFKIIAQEIHSDKGEIYIRKNLKLGHLEQHTRIESSKTIFQECLTIFEDLILMEKNLRKMEEEISLLSNKNLGQEMEALMEEYSRESERFQELNGYGYESSIRGTLIGLGFSEDDFYKEVNLLSGGQKSRLALAKLLLSSPDILLLDEPTNHLDIEAIDWLAKFIQDYSGAVLLISHDRYFLDMVVNRIFHLENLTLYEYNTNYTDFVKRRKENILIYKKHYEEQEREIKREKEIIEKYKTYGGERYNRLAKSREKLLEKKEVMEKFREEDSLRFKFKPKLESGNDVLEVENLSKSYNGKLIFKDLNFSIYKGERIGLIGGNGVGKSSLFKIILNQIKDYDGDIQLGHKVNIGYFDQEMSGLNLEKTVIDEIWDENPNFTETELRTILSQFMFLADDVFKKVKDLSGGEKARLSILKLMLSEANFLLLDEPTNHLDIQSKEVLEEAILDYEGTVFVISHDRYFLNKIVDKIFLMKSNGIEQYLGNYDYYIEKVNQSLEKNDKDEEKTKTQIQNERKKEREIQRLERKKRKEIESLEDKINKLEKELNLIDQQLSDNSIYQEPKKVLKYTEKRDTIESKLEKFYEDWLLLTEE